MGDVAFCRRCRRRLTNRISIVRGYGSSCYARVMGHSFKLGTRSELLPPTLEPFKPTKTILEAWGESMPDLLKRQRKLEEVEPALDAVAKEAEQIHKKAKGS